MLINEYIAMQLHKTRQNELKPEAHGNRILAEIINEYKEQYNRRVRKTIRK